MPELSILNVWDILMHNNSLVLAHFDKLLWHVQLKGFTVLLNVFAAGPCDQHYY